MFSSDMSPIIKDALTVSGNQNGWTTEQEFSNDNIFVKFQSGPQLIAHVSLEVRQTSHIRIELMDDISGPIINMVCYKFEQFISE